MPDMNFLAGSGIQFNKSIILYCRPMFHRQIEFLHEDGALGWILGPPGTGKSTTALAFCCMFGQATMDYNLDSPKTAYISSLRSYGGQYGENSNYRL